MGRGTKDAGVGASPRRVGRARGRTPLLFGLLLFLPAAALVADGGLSVDDALLRFAGAVAFALFAGFVLSAVTRPAPKRPADLPAPGSEQPGPA